MPCVPAWQEVTDVLACRIFPLIGSLVHKTEYNSSAPNSKINFMLFFSCSVQKKNKWSKCLPRRNKKDVRDYHVSGAHEWAIGCFFSYL
jgi:hypothetical protein